MKRKGLMMAMILLLAGALSACNITINTGSESGSGNGTAATGESVPYSGQEASEATVPDVESVFDDGNVAEGDFKITAANGSAVKQEGNVYTLTAADTYTLTGTLPEGQVIVDAGEEKVTLVLAGTSITSSTGAAILGKSADKLNVEAAEGTYNEIHDTRTATLSSEDTEVNFDAAVWAACDLDLQGTGTLIVTSDKNNGVKTKDDLEVKSLNLKVTAYGNALKGNDTVLVESGTLLLISEDSDGIKTSNSDVSNKGNQRGTITIAGGTVEIRSANDGIQAAYDAEISGDDTVVTIYTADYAGEAGEDEEGGKLYLIVSTSLYSSTTDYYAYFYNETEGVFVKAEYETMVSSGRRASYYGLAVKVPSGYPNVRLVTVSGGVTPTTEEYEAVSSGEPINTAMNGYLFSSVSGGAIDGDWVQLTTGSGNSAKTTYSSKGVKAANEIRILGGTVTIKAMDDAIHANAGDKLENGETGIGSILIKGGTVTITSADDGMHADGDLAIEGGTVNVKESHEGLEGNQVLISGGSTFVYGKDDGINATSGAKSALVQVTGGYLEVTTPSGDTDAIDANGSYVQSGGFVIVKGGSSQGSVAGSVDVDGSITVTGGTIIAFGGICELPSNSVNVYVSQGTTFQAGTYEVTANGTSVLDFTLDSSYSSVWIAGDALETGNAYTMSRDGSGVLVWTQEEGRTGNFNGGGGFGPGGGFNPGRK